MKKNVSMEEAQQLFLAQAAPAGERKISLAEAAGSLLSRDVFAPLDLPPFDRSPLDGYALRAADVRQASKVQPVALRVVEEVRAGFVSSRAMESGCAVKIMTGAPLPDGADVVVPFEEVERKGGVVCIMEPMASGSNIIYAGEDLAVGNLAAKKGALVTPSLVGLLASLGMETVPVYGKCKVALFSTGDELVEPPQALRPGKIYNSNLHSLRAYCRMAGAETVALGTVVDEEGAIAARLEEALRQADLVVTTGGVSVGDYDLLPAVLQKVGAQVLFHGLDMKPGSPAMGAVCRGKPVLALSGNPAAALIAFELVGAPLLKKMLGWQSVLPQRVCTILGDDFTKASRQRRFVRVRLEVQGMQLSAKLAGSQSNGALQSMVASNALLDVPAGSGPLKAGQLVTAVLTGPLA
ncbi:gephyrin-like molybdotransferase Glp [Anaeroarcus burkinensis]|uniref:molybdopterin molybdotransferase MoeA n=1 Tax=Anaeroarcus burkinensis TaxID=82376 RepID=UPI000402D317|nr:gephyrin-like molybdotransferase Glp [Anaeroarcus burkinensis]